MILKILYYGNMNFFDLPRQGQWNFQDPASPLMEGIIDLHHNILFVLLLILGVVTFLMFSILKDTSYIWTKPNKEHIERQKKYLQFNGLVHGTVLEIVWTIIPSIILFVIAIPSFALLYSMEEVLEPQMTVKVIANQWYWSYEYGNLGLEWDSYMINESDLAKGELRLLTVDHPLFLPVETNIRLLITSKDVIHSFAVPSLGLKVDAVPGRLNQLSCYINRTGIFYGQCSELCGVNHAFMPIEIVSIVFGTSFFVSQR
jgi:cytochrome c oxidase subunit 2